MSNDDMHDELRALREVAKTLEAQRQRAAADLAATSLALTRARQDADFARERFDDLATAVLGYESALATSGTVAPVPARRYLESAVRIARGGR